MTIRPFKVTYYSPLVECMTSHVVAYRQTSKCGNYYAQAASHQELRRMMANHKLTCDECGSRERP